MPLIIVFCAIHTRFCPLVDVQQLLRVGVMHSEVSHFLKISDSECLTFSVLFNLSTANYRLPTWLS